MKKFDLIFSIIFLLAFANISAQDGTLKWEFQTGGYVTSSPAIADDGTIYAGSHDTYLYAIHPDGTQKWKFKTERQVWSSPAIGADGTIYFGSGNYFGGTHSGDLYAVSPAGRLLWKVPVGGDVLSSPAIAIDGTIYFATSWPDHAVYAVTPAGQIRWSFTAGGVIISSPAIDVDDTIYLGSKDDHLYALNPDGSLKWKYNSGRDIESSPAIGADGTIYVGSYDHCLHAVRRDGTLKWKYEMADLVEFASPAIGVDGTIYCGNMSDHFYAINPDGSLKWSYETDNWIQSTPAVGSDGTIFLGSGDDHIYAFLPDGSLKWKHKTGEIEQSSPAISSDGTLYFGGGNSLYAFSTDCGGPAESAWPMFGGNSRHTGNLADHRPGRLQAIIETDTVYCHLNDVFTLSAAASIAPNKDELTYQWSITDDPNNAVSLLYNTEVTCQIQISAPGKYQIQVNISNDDNTSFATATIFCGYKWKFNSSGVIRYSSPTVDTDGSIIVGSYENVLNAINSDGTVKWKFTQANGFFSSPAISPEHTIYAGNWDGNLYAVTNNGTLKWKLQTDYLIESSPAIGHDGTVYIGSYDDKLYAVHPDGVVLWTFKTDNYITASPAVGADGTIYIGSFDKYFYAVNPDGEMKWKFNLGNRTRSSAAIDSDGTIYVGSDANNLFAFHPDGTLKWKFQTGGDVESSPTIGPEGTIYVGSYDHKLYAINGDGTLKWEFQTDNRIVSTAAIGADNTVFVGSTDNHLYALKPDGTLKWKIMTEADVISSPVIDQEGTVYIGSNDNYLYAIETNCGGLADSAWPMRGKNAQHHGSVIEPVFTHPPQAIIDQDTVYCQVGETVTLSGAASIDPNGDELSFHWSALEKIPGVVFLDSTHVTCQFQVSHPANFQIRLTVSNENGTSYATATVICGLKWTFSAEKQIRSVPAIGEDGTIYFGSNDHYLYSLDKNGNLKWKFKTGNEILAASVIGETGTIYVASTDNSLYALNPDGALVWQFITQGKMVSSPAIGYDGTIYVGSDDHHLYAIHPDGTEKWRFRQAEHRFSAPVIDLDSTIYVKSYHPDSYLYAIKPDGSLLWRLSTHGNESAYYPDTYRASPSIGADGMIFFGNDAYYVLAANQDGQVKWEFVIAAFGIFCSPVVDSDNAIYLGGTEPNRDIVALDREGNLKWRYATGAGIHGTAALSADGTLFVPSKDNYLHAISLDGALKWKFNTGQRCYVTMIGPDGTVYVTSEETIYALDANCGGFAQTPWPCFGGNAQHTGNINQNYIVDVEPPVMLKQPEHFFLYANYPNPFNPSTAIVFDLPRTVNVTLKVYNSLGKPVCELFHGTLSAGHYNFIWDATNQNGQKVSSGIYFLKMTAPAFCQIRKMLFIQ